MASGSSGVDLSQIPLSQPPPGEVTNFVDPPSISWAGRLSIYITLPIMGIAFVLRSYVRIRSHQVGVDDYLLFFGAAGAASFCGVILPVFNEDVLGRHAWDIPVSAIQPWSFQYSATAGCLYNVSAMFTKISILALYFRAFHPSRRARLFIWLGVAVISTSYIALTASLLFYLLPHEGDGGWNSPANLQRAGNPSRIIDFTQGAFSALSDFYVLLIPAFVVASLQLPLKKKIGITCIFLTGLVSCGCSVAGIAFRSYALFQDVIDNRWNSVKFEALCVAELNVGVFCACAPVFFVLFRTFMKNTESGIVYLRRRLSPRTGGRHTTKTNAANMTEEHHPKFAPKIPQSTLTGLLSFFQRVGRTQNKDTTNTATTLPVSQYLELQSIDYDYHAQIRQDSRDLSNKSLIATRSHAQVPF